jgi:taurine--2-oxoglutarate transaminase
VHFHHAYPFTFSRYAHASNRDPGPGGKWETKHAERDGREADLECAERALAGLHEQILAEGPHTIALIMHEGVTGSNGTIAHPPGYLEGVRAMCDKYGIMMGIDEVMSGWGRTGKLFGFQHSDGVVPDLMSSAKGINGALLPLGMIAMRDHVAKALETTPVAIGSTYNGHPVALASAYGTIQHFLKTDVLGNVRKLQPVVEEAMQELADRHPSVKQARTIGLLGSIDIQKSLDGEFLAQPWEAPHPKMLEFRDDLIKQGAWTLVKGHSVFVCPPLIITPEEVKAMFAILSRSMPILDGAMEK